MSQKVVTRSKKQSEDEANGEFKTPDNCKTKEEGTKSMKSKNETAKSEGEDGKKGAVKDSDQLNGDSSESTATKRSIHKRSRSNTPSIKNDNAKDEEDPKENTEEKEIKKDNDTSPAEAGKESDIILKDVVINIQTLQTEKYEPKNSRPSSPSTSVEMDPLILEKEDEEPIPELQFDENDIEVESEGSNSRCKTRRSHSRNVSTPKTPKIADQEAEELEIVDLSCDSRGGSVTPKKMASSNDPNIININLQPPEETIDLNDTSDTYSSVSTDNLSTKAVVGNDATRNFDFTGQDSSIFDTTTNSTFSNRSYADTVKSLSGRRGIHSAACDNYRKYVLKNTVDGKGDIYSDYESVQKITMGMKRKSRSFSPTPSKRVKSDSPGLFSYLSSPITNFRQTFKKSSTPQLVMVEKCDFDTDGDFDKIKLENGMGDGKKRCNIM
ncbi:hypothetical protein PPYR_12328 [Photinus pyralis]|uniref:Uncharacterized protein n=1 Tax=Photinus pyralis TaxID=7054 RepID=A0A5N4ADW8_PHOPY|nr:uncharacterized protein LOC116175734 [Photinus pyralis]KAB0795489.1 hypothetical protein PPYR_12328 [Photinus pyralis]